MSTNDKQQPTVTPDGAVELDESQLEQAAGGAHDFYLKIDGVPGESKIVTSGLRTQKVSPASIKTAFGDGSV